MLDILCSRKRSLCWTIWKPVPHCISQCSEKFPSWILAKIEPSLDTGNGKMIIYRISDLLIPGLTSYEVRNSILLLFFILDFVCVHSAHKNKFMSRQLTFSTDFVPRFIKHRQMLFSIVIVLKTYLQTGIDSILPFAMVIFPNTLKRAPLSLYYCTSVGLYECL